MMGDDPEDALEFDEAKQLLAKRYQREAILLSLLSLALFSMLTFASLPSGISLRLESWAHNLNTSPWLIVALYVSVAYVFLNALSLPIRVVGRRSDLKYGLTKQSWPSWAGDRLKSLAFGLLFAIVAIEALYWSIRNFGTLWWLVFWMLSVGFALVAGYVAPVLFLPFFYRVRRMEDTDVVERLENLAERAEVKVMGVYEVRSSPKTERGTAALAGLGHTRRILLSDHILRNYTTDEVEGILAHELAHHIQRDSAFYLLLSASTSLVALLLSDLFVRSTMSHFGISGLSQIANLPLFALFAILFRTATGPPSRYVSRRRESRADMIGASLSGHPRSLASALIKLHNQNLSDATPPAVVEALLYTHPSGHRRVEALLSMAERRGPSGSNR